jgi:hypothetical protein
MWSGVDLNVVTRRMPIHLLYPEENHEKSQPFCGRRDYQGAGEMTRHGVLMVLREGLIDMYQGS